jgi:hypothetical protein
MDHMQALVDGMSAQWQRERAATQMTLGALIVALDAMPPGAEIDGIQDPHSYRGYYADLAFEPKAGRVLVSEALAMCREAMGQVFTGYKGGDYVMGALTPLWISNYGTTIGARKILSVDAKTGHIRNS